VEAPKPQGLSSAEAAARLATEGRNALPSAPPRRIHQRVFAQLSGGLSLLLLAAAILDVGLWLLHGAEGVALEPLAIVSVLAINTVLGVLQEFRSERALAELRNLSQPMAWTLREQVLTQIPAEEIVREDVLRIEAGDRVPADGTLLEQSALAVDESMLTGESIPIDKRAGDAVACGTVVVRGHALLSVTATGERSAMGRLAGELIGIETGQTPLERRISAFGRTIAWVAGVAVVALIALGLLSEGLDRVGMVVTFAIALAVAVVPEGLPAVITLTLALGVERMARRSAVVRRLAAVEALGSVTVIATDKTGTLTENRLRVVEIFAANERALIEAGILANDADVEGSAGDPLDLALLEHARLRDVNAAALRLARPRLSARPFDSDWKFMRVTVDGPRGPESFLKGAVEALLPLVSQSEADKQQVLALMERESARGRRLIAVARAAGEREDELTLLGLVAFWDPPRKGVESAVAAVRAAGVRMLMITGDHPTTAAAIAEQVGLRAPRVITGGELRALPLSERVDRLAVVDVVARATAEDKLFIVEALQNNGDVVAMTGDGINDAPALKKADVGVAMGQRGSDVAREVSDLVLLDDNFSTIVSAVEEGRNIRDNIQKFIRFTFSTNVALAILVLGGALGSYAIGLRDAAGALILPLTAIQVLFINFMGDGPPALALAVDKNPSVMQQPPQPSSAPLLDSSALRFILIGGVLQGVVGLTLLLVLPGFGLQVLAIQTLVFVYEAAAKLVSVYPARRVSGEIAPNRALRVAMALGLLLILACLYVPALRGVLGLTLPTPLTLGAIAACVLFSWTLTELLVLRWRWLPRGRIRDAGPAHS
jgi:P-type Ca2+ transporter type 2C